MNEQEINQLIEGMAENFVKACDLAANKFPGIDPAGIASRACALILIAVADSGKKDSALLTVRKDASGEGWMSHIHMDYLDADPAHLMEDFHLPPAGDNKRSEYHD